MTNIFALRSTDPKALRRVDDPVGPENDAAIVLAAQRADLVVAAWGTHGAYQGRGSYVRELLETSDIEVSFLKLTKQEHPGHPLYVPATTAPTRWSRSSSPT